MTKTQLILLALEELKNASYSVERREECEELIREIEMEVDRHEVIAWAENIVRMYGTEFSPSERDYHLAQSIIDADEEFLSGVARAAD